MTSIIINKAVNEENLFTEGRMDKSRRNGTQVMRNLLDYQPPEFGFEDGILAKEYYFKSNDLLSRLNEKAVKNNYKDFKKNIIYHKKNFNNILEYF